MTTPATPRSERRLLWLLMALELTLLLDFMILMPLGPELMASSDLTPAGFGTLVSSYTLASALAGATGALWLDRFQRKRMLLFLYALFVVAALGCGSSRGFASLLVARLLAGACAGLVWALILATVIDVVPAQRRGQALGVVMTSYAVAAVVGVPLGLTLSGYWGWRAPFIVVSALSAVLWFVALRLLPRDEVASANGAPPLAPARTFGTADLFSSAHVRAWALTFMVVFAGFLLIPYLGTFMVENLGVASKQLGWVYLCGGLAAFFSSRFIGACCDRFRPERVLALLLLASAIPHLWFTRLADVGLWQVIAVFVLFMTLTSGRVIPTVALITEDIPPALRARFMAVNTATVDAASGLAAWTSGFFLTATTQRQLIGFERMGTLAVCVSACALCALWLFVRNSPNRARQALPSANLGRGTP